MIKKTFFFILLIFSVASFIQPGSCARENQQKNNIFSVEEIKSCFHLNTAGHNDRNPASKKHIEYSLTSDGYSQPFPNYEITTHEEIHSKKSNRKRIGRAFLLNYSLVIANSIKYWIKYSQWIEDWQFQLNWKDQTRRWFSIEGYKFDSNPFLTNWTHILSGAIYYNFARYNMLNTLESTLFMLGSNFYWEYITEWREVISINDNICSGLGGVTIGEPLYWIGSYFSQKQGFVNKILGFIFNPVVGLNHLLDKNKSKLDILQSTRPRFSLFFGPKSVSVDDNGSDEAYYFNLGTEIRYYLIEGYGKPVDLNHYYKNTIFTELSADFTVGANSIEEYTLFTRAILFGRFKQKLIPDGHSRVRGYNLILGAGTAFDYYQKKPVAYYDKGEYHFDFTGGETAPQPTEFSDKMAVLNLIGPVFEISFYSHDFSLRASAAAYVDFGLINSLAINTYSEENNLYATRMKTTLSYYGYYYALGFTLSSDIQASYRALEILGKFKYQSYDSIQELDRFQENVTDDSDLVDSRLQVKLGLGYSIPKTPVHIVLTYENITRKGTLKDINQRSVENRIYTQLKISF
jgi:hypothetical protein